MSSQPADHQGRGFPAIYPGTSQKVTVSGTSAQSAAMGTDTNVARLFSTTDCHIKIATNPTALADGTSMFLPAGIVEYIGIKAGQKIAAIQNTAGGTLYITEGAKL